MSQASAAVAFNRHPVDREAGSNDVAAVVRHLAHELRQPLSTIESIAYYLEIVLARHDGRTRQQLEKLQRLVHQANWILSDAVHYLQASPARPQLLDLDEMVSQAVVEWAKGERIPVHMELSSQPTLVRLDPEQAKHLVCNVLTCFRQLASSQPRLTVRIGSRPGEYLLEFCAEGVDCRVQELRSMFEPFGSHLPAGCGLSLASVERIVESHGGRVELVSTPSEGILLVVAFPAAG